jgi:hypothetical protein
MTERTLAIGASLLSPVSVGDIVESSLSVRVDIIRSYVRYLLNQRFVRMRRSRFFITE